MQNFTFNIPTVVHFGKGQISKLGEEIASRASRVLVVYGGGSVKRNGVYDGAVEQMKATASSGWSLAAWSPTPALSRSARAWSCAAPTNWTVCWRWAAAA